MAQGLRSHWHQFYEDHYDIKYDEERHCDKKIVYYRCMICGREHVDICFSDEAWLSLELDKIIES